MQLKKVAGSRTLSGEPQRSTAYYYGDLERIKQKNYPTIHSNGARPAVDGTRPAVVGVRPNFDGTRPSFDGARYATAGARQGAEKIQPPNGAQHGTETRINPDELSEYVESNEVINDGAVREVPPLRDRGRQWSLPEYSTPENSRKGPDTYSTAGTFPMPEPKEKEPLLAELEVVGRLPLSQLDSGSGMRRSRSWYLCCPNVPDEEISRESSWRYSSLRPVTAPPVPGRPVMVAAPMATESSGRDDTTSIRAERDSLARALAAERQRAANQARAHDARLAELHGVIAELVRRRAADKHSCAIPEEDGSDECESTTQPAGELDNDADRSKTDQNDSSSILSPSELPTPQDPKHELPDDDAELHDKGVDLPRVELSTELDANCDASLQLSEKESDPCPPANRFSSGECGVSGGSTDRQNGSTEESRVFAVSPGRCASRQAKLASRVRLRRTQLASSKESLSNDESWMEQAARNAALELCGHAARAEAQLTDQHGSLSANLSAWKARCSRLEADLRVSQCALARATDTAHRLSCACAVQESCCVCVCAALRSADRALEAYDVLLALAETAHAPGAEREAAELVARQLTYRLENEPSATIGEPLLSPGPWKTHHHHMSAEGDMCSVERRLRWHAARLKADTVTLRALADHNPQMFSYHDEEEDEMQEPVAKSNILEMEAAIMMQEVLSMRESEATSRAEQLTPVNLRTHSSHKTKNDSMRNRRRAREKHWLDTQASETDL